MANLPEAAVWPAGIYQWEKTDPVEGGPNGIDNVPTKQLADRTRWLRNLVEAVGYVADTSVTNQSHLAALLGQLARQVDGGRIALAGGSLDDPALRIGTASVYSAAADTLSVAVAGVERLRITTSGITVFGTVTEA